MTAEELSLKRDLIRQRKLDGQVGAVQEAVEEIQPVVEEESSKYVFLAFARVFSGTISKGQTLFILSPRHNPADFTGKVKRKS